MSYEDANALLNDPRITNDRSTLPVKALPENKRAPFEKFTEFLATWLPFYEDNAHLIRRQSMNHAFKLLTPTLITHLTTELADYLIRDWQPGQTVDLVADFAEPLASIVLTQMVGAPTADHEQLNRWASDLSYLFAASEITVNNLSRAWESAQAMMNYLRRLAKSAEQFPEYSILARMLGGNAKHYRYSVEETFAQIVLLYFAALEPSRDIIGNAVFALDAFPEQQQLLSESANAWKTAVDEFLRFDPPVQYIGRMAGESFNYRGHEIKKGQMVFPHVGSANRDPAFYDNPDQLQVTRQAKNLSMGEGIHRCIGYRMVKVQTEAALKTLLKRFPNLNVSK